MYKVKTYEEYFPKWVSDSTEDRKKAQIKKKAKMDDDDPSAYKKMPGDTKGKDKLKKSKHTVKYHELYGKNNEEKEGGMYLSALNNIVTHSSEIINLIDENMELPAWVQDKITLSEHNMDAVLNFLKTTMNDEI